MNIRLYYKIYRSVCLFLCSILIDTGIGKCSQRKQLTVCSSFSLFTRSLFPLGFSILFALKCAGLYSLAAYNTADYSTLKNNQQPKNSIRCFQMCSIRAALGCLKCEHVRKLVRMGVTSGSNLSEGSLYEIKGER